MFHIRNTPATASTDVARSKRNSKYVDADLQGNLMIRLAGYWLIYNIALLLTLGGNRLVGLLPDILSGDSNVNLGLLYSGFLADMKPLMLAMAVFCPLMIWDMIRYSHRVAGPLYRFKKAMREHMAGQELTTVKLREGDMLMDFQHTYNDFVQHVRNQRGLETANAVSKDLSRRNPAETSPLQSADQA